MEGWNIQNALWGSFFLFPRQKNDGIFGDSAWDLARTTGGSFGWFRLAVEPPKFDRFGCF